MLHKNRLHPFYFQKVQDLNQEDYLSSALEFLKQRTLQPDFTAHVLFTDEARMYLMHIICTCGEPIIHMQRGHMCINNFSEIVWAGIVYEFLIGPYLLTKRLDSCFYIIFLEQVLLLLLQDVSISIRNRMLF